MVGKQSKSWPRKKFAAPEKAPLTPLEGEEAKNFHKIEGKDDEVEANIDLGAEFDGSAGNQHERVIALSPPRGQV